MNNRTRLVLCLDLGMLVLVCVLECLSLTGLNLHEWLGFVLCPLVLWHVVLQWPWFVAQCRRVLAPGAYRARINSFLNIALLFMMAAVLLSGVLISSLAAPLLDERLGRMPVWNEVHGWLNFVVVVLVGLHLALNWDWIVAALRRRGSERPALAGAPARNTTTPFGNRFPGFANSLVRGLVVLIIASLAAGLVYWSMDAMLYPRGRPPDERKAAVPAVERPRTLPPRQKRPVHLPHGFEQLAVCFSILVLVVLIGRHVFRLRL